MIQLFRKLFRLTGVRYTDKYLSTLVSKTPCQDSLYGIGIVLDKYNIAHKCVRYAEKSEFEATNTPCVIIYEKDFAIVISADNKKVALYTDGIAKVVDRQSFDCKWNGVVMQLHVDGDSKEKDYDDHIAEAKKIILKKAGLIAGALVFAIALFILPASMHQAPLLRAIVLLVNICGLMVAVMLLQKQLHIPNRFADKLCGIVKESSCEDVTESEGASLFGLVKLSEVGFGFFASNLVMLLIFPDALFWLAVYSVAVLPFSFWSLWYQKFKAKSWCVLCLSTLALMWLQAGCYLVGDAFSPSSALWPYLFAVGALYVVAVITVNFLMDKLESLYKSKALEAVYNHLKANEKVIEALVNSDEELDISDPTCSSLVFGNPDAEKKLTIFSNPYCGPCAMMHGLIKNLPGQCVNVRYVFTSFNDDLSIINKYLIAAYQQLGADRTWKLLTEWFTGGKARGADFFAPYHLDIDRPEVAIEYQKQREWPKNKGINGTPSDFINGRRIVWPYTAEDYSIL